MDSCSNCGYYEQSQRNSYGIGYALPFWKAAEEAGKISNIAKLTSKWELDNLCIDLIKSECTLKSPNFIVNDNSKTYVWGLILQTTGETDSQDIVTLEVVALNRHSKIFQNYSFTIVNKKQNHIISSYRFHGLDNQNISFERNLIINAKSGNLLGDNLTIFCNITFEETETSVFERYSLTRIHQELSYLENLLDDKRFSDVTLKVYDQMIYAHKSILTSRSSVFEAMFKHELKEKLSNIVEFKDVDPESFREMLRFMYTGKVNDIDKDAYELLSLADVYSIEGLKSLCEEVIKERLTVHNAVTYLKYADDCNALELKKQVIKFITKNSVEMSDLPEYQLIEKIPSKLLIELVKALSLKKNEMF